MTATATDETEEQVQQNNKSGTNENGDQITTIHNEQSGENAIASSQNSSDLKLNDIFSFLSENRAIVFKSQQIDDPEIISADKITIARNLFAESHLKFLRKFGQYLTKDQLSFLLGLEDAQTLDYEVNFLFKTLLSNLEHRQSSVKNRRFSAMKKMLIEQNEYFSETEMMKREPFLYEQLVGQYLTDTEKKVRDGYDPKTTLFSQILLENYDRDEREKLRKQQELLDAELADEEEDFDADEESTQKSFTSSKITHTGAGEYLSGSEETFPKVPPSYRKLWGNFEDDNQNSDSKEVDDRVKPGTSKDRLSELLQRNKKLDAKQKYVTAGEREMLRQEFLGIMRAKFIDGADKDFDYSNIDDNTELDDLDQINQDCEDKYFETDDDLIDVVEQNQINYATDNQVEMEDDLDSYMKSLHKIVNP